MKKLLVGLLALTTLTSSANASYYVNGGVGFSSYYFVKTNDQDITKFDTNPINYFLSAKMNIAESCRAGIEFKGIMNVDKEDNKIPDILRDIENPYSLFATIGYYPTWFNIFANFKMGYNFSSRTENSIYEVNPVAVGFDFGGYYEIVENVSLSIKAESSSTLFTEKENKENLAQLLNTSLSLGLTYKF